MQTTKVQISLHILQSDQRLCWLDSMIPIVAISAFPRLLLASVAEWTSLCLTWLQTPKTDFLMMQLIIDQFVKKTNLDFLSSFTSEERMKILIGFSLAVWTGCV